MNEKENVAARTIAKEFSPDSPVGTQSLRLRDTFPIPDDKSILVCTVGGVGQIGMNWTLYGHKGRWVLVDAGSAFSPRDIDGVEAIFPDFKSLKPILSRLDALVVTHAHEDHIGAIHRHWPNIRCPIYATPFATEVLKARFSERDTQGKVTIKRFTPGDVLKIGNFSIKTVRVTHSVPECVALAFRTKIGTVVHTGDWKFDPDPVIGKPTDRSSLQRLGDEGVMALISDSTNANRAGKSTSERSLEAGMTAVMRDTRGLVAVACFATNVARVATTVRAAAASGRQIALSGRSLIKTEAIARKLGMLQGVPPILAESHHLRGLPRREMALLVTGAQGEERAALSKLSTGDNWRLPKCEEGDAVILSARAIPGNEPDIDRIVDRFADMGVAVHQREYNGLPLHVTGHAVASELERMYAFIRPKFSIPVHGEEAHLEAHAALAEKMGVDEVFIPREGLVLRVTPEDIRAVAEVHINLVCELTVGDGTFPDWNEEEFRHIQSMRDDEFADLEEEAPVRQFA